MGSPRFGRVCRLEFLDKPIRPITDLRIQFETESNDGQQMNRANIVVYNLEPNARAAIARPVQLDVDINLNFFNNPIVTVKLFAGYKDDLVQLFAGNIWSCFHNKVGPDWITTMELLTNYEQMMKSQVQVSFGEPTAPKDIVQEILKPLKLNVKFTSKATQVLEQSEKVSDYSTSGLAYREADNFLKKYGLSFTSEDDGQGLVYDPSEPRDPDVAKTNYNTISPETGLVGTPKITSSGVELKTLLRPNLKLFQKIFVEAETLRGTLKDSTTYAAEYYPIHIKHTGDNRGDEWHTDIDATYISIVNRSPLR